MTPREKILREAIEELVTQAKRFISQDTTRLNHAILIARETLARADAVESKETDGWIAVVEESVQALDDNNVESVLPKVQRFDLLAFLPTLRNLDVIDFDAARGIRAPWWRRVWAWIVRG